MSVQETSHRSAAPDQSDQFGLMVKKQNKKSTWLDIAEANAEYYSTAQEAGELIGNLRV